MASLPTTPLDQLPAPRQNRIHIYALRALIWLLILGAFWFAFTSGLRLRHWVFQTADPIRFIDDLRHGTMWGLLASGPEGYLNQYEKMDLEVPEWQDQNWTPWLDYSPLRLLVMRQWGAWQRVHHPPDPNVPLMDAWQRSYDFNAPVLRFNTCMEGLAAIGAFFLTRYWVIRGRGPNPRTHFLGVWQGAVAALLVWFSPDLILNAHAWPQWDTWIVPCYLAGCLLASLDWWFAAGIAIAIGANLKGQMLSITPIFIIWPLVQRRIGAPLRWISGFVLAYALITSGWLVTYLPPAKLAAAQDRQLNIAVTDFPPDLFVIPRIFDIPAAIWIAEMLLITAAVPWLLRILTPPAPTSPAPRWKTIASSRQTWIAAGAILIVASVCWPWLLPKNRATWYVGLLAGAAVAAAAMLLRPRNQRYILSFIAGAALFACMLLFHGSTCWWDCAIHYGSIHWPYLFTGPVSNVPSVFQIRFGWPREVDQVAFTLPAIHGHWPTFFTSRFWWPAFDTDVSAKMLFNTLYAVMLLLSGIAIGIQTRRNDRRALVAFVTPWIMMFLFPVQIQERYLLYGVGAACCCIGDSVGMALLGFLLGGFSLIMPLKELFDINSSDLDAFGQNLSQQFPKLFSPQIGYTLKPYLDGTQPDIAYGILIIGLVFLYVSFIPSRKSISPPRSSPQTPLANPPAADSEN